MRPLLALALVLTCLFVAQRAAAHGMRTAALRLDEVGPRKAMVHFATTVPDASVAPSFPPACTATAVESLAASRERALILTCDRDLPGLAVGVTGLGPIVTEATIFVSFLDGRTASHLVTREAPSWELPRVESSLDIAKSYVRFGVVHILTGPDHLLFLALLVLLLRRTRAVLLAETAFTVSHSLAFTATALGWVRVSPLAAEACIALSLLLVALDVRPAASPTVSAPRGALAALVFGLVHGLGFAGGMRELGLPDHGAAVALGGFGVGVELGQVAFLALVLGVVHLAARSRLWPRIALAGTHAVGGLSVFWLVQRLLACLAV